MPSKLIGLASQPYAVARSGMPSTMFAPLHLGQGPVAAPSSNASVVCLMHVPLSCYSVGHTHQATPRR